MKGEVGYPVKPSRRWENGGETKISEVTGTGESLLPCLQVLKWWSTGREGGVLGGTFFLSPFLWELVSGTLGKNADVGSGWACGHRTEPACVAGVGRGDV